MISKMALGESFNDDEHFTIANIPFGVASLRDSQQTKFIATRLYEHVYSIPNLISQGLLDNLPDHLIDALSEPTLNRFISLPKPVTRQLRTSIQNLLGSETSSEQSLLSCRYHKTDVISHLPVTIGDFTDFSCSMNHVQNAAEAIFGKRSMPPCFLHFPPGYSGRCSSIVSSGTPIKRPVGQYRNQNGSVVYGPSQQVDFELEVAAVIGQPTTHGKPVHISHAEEHIFGVVLLNDWSARDIQALEMSPLGPLNGKSFGTTISPWIITLDALQPYSCSLPTRDTSVDIAPYLRLPDGQVDTHYSINTHVSLLAEKTSTTICKSNFASLYWSLSALLAHQTSNGCPLMTGDLLGTGTISGSSPGEFGCLLEATRGGKEAISLDNGDSRVYLKDGDGVRLTAWAGDLGSRDCVGFGDCFGVLESAIQL